MDAFDHDQLTAGRGFFLVMRVCDPEKYEQNDVRNTGLYPTNNKLIDGNSISFVEIVIPIKIAGIHYKQAITVYNRWMVALVDCLIAMV